MNGLTCERHGTFALCRQCGAAQTPEHDCIANHKPKPVPVKRKTQTRTFSAQCCICGDKILRGKFCMKHQKYKSRVYYHQRKGMPKAQVLAQVIAEAKEQEKITAMLANAQEVNIMEVLT